MGAVGDNASGDGSGQAIYPDGTNRRQVLRRSRLSRIVQVLIVYQSMRWVFRVSIPDDPAWPRWPPAAALKSNRFAEAIRGGRQIMPVSLSLIGKIGVN